MAYVEIREVEFSDAAVPDDRKQIIKDFLLLCDADASAETKFTLTFDPKQALPAMGGYTSDRLQLESEIKALSPIRIKADSGHEFLLEEPELWIRSDRSYLWFARFTLFV
ncbi:hypothetical protein NIES2135_53390 [Leptolyngbya boryana NIES-2135]|jgi:hypothetical protein|uniref:Uncharacterized protein n=1 Tax=Leptolyngbya boryana NIES-2135 TaxID=1973484 RepID=A0A1Z4JP29_LEPBY|nr:MULTISPECIES: hypothetical protein [Leptolyngbya]BAY58466.1 hypothetical protein NIES2135_53390 [Leptolyngbya boryana NIES-2135]MBD2370940.1 hypothetical protein [Leptolyngbya sp. FACHB-161]MBD2377454.1 hypothetical protein [Leptolyngbya sp. FACHB-238]MBD2401862.1 hypothetical protein [Leptolyngbya sp. FACHB-239]MBD2408380.1 hypothetical protein [Leptolyngbya sp. FACHB-402]